MAAGLIAGAADPGEAARKKKHQKPATAEKSAPAEVKIPSGPLNIVVSLKEQRLTVFASDGSTVASSPISSGRSGFATPMGVFSILQKNKDHVSNLYGAAMPYMQRLTWSGIALHAGALPGYPASHGCIRLPHAFAKRLFSMTRMGARVVVTGSSTRPVPVSHPSLFVPGPLAPEDVLPGMWRARGFTTASAEPAAPAHLPTLALVAEATLPSGSGDFLRLDNGARLPAATHQDAAAAPRAFSVEFASATAVEGELLAAQRSAKRLGKGTSITVLVSRKLGKLLVRRAGATLFEAPVAIVDSHRPIGTHVLTATAFTGGGKTVDWMAVSIPSGQPKSEKKASKADKKSKRKGTEEIVVAAPGRATLDAHAALDRIAFPQEASRRIAGLLTPGSTVMISDNGISHETGRGTDFILLTR